MGIKCKKCGRFIGNSNCSTAGGVADGYRGQLECDKCLDQSKGKEFEQWQNEGSTRTSSECGSAASRELCTPGSGDVPNAEKPLLTLVFPNYRPPSLNEVLAQHWSKRQRSKNHCSELVELAASSLREATGRPGRLIVIICWAPVKSSGTKSRQKSSAEMMTPNPTRSSGSTGRSRAGASRWKFSKRKPK